MSGTSKQDQDFLFAKAAPAFGTAAPSFGTVPPSCATAPPSVQGNAGNSNVAKKRKLEEVHGTCATTHTAATEIRNTTDNIHKKRRREENHGTGAKKTDRDTIRARLQYRMEDSGDKADSPAAKAPRVVPGPPHQECWDNGSGDSVIFAQLFFRDRQLEREAAAARHMAEREERLKEREAAMARDTAEREERLKTQKMFLDAIALLGPQKRRYSN